ncbi:uncharacterized mitochondrial protein AtMg00860-like [Penaeus monodon]|uniref:uncharacterized mitochondrial protein AtMg00860-like n=1 Tax=Penaeus monodon TaxID=6687 RepID=UPI0018A7B485|nr:uncharacterized mitochondrial protein AtMg00860-like [Penaeus monodon]
MTVRPSKCEIGFKEFQYLGHTLGDGRCSSQNDKIKKIKDAPRPTTKKQVRSFLGLTGYYRSFVPNFAVLALPLFDLLKKHAPNKIRWGDEQEVAFNSLKKLLCKPHASGESNNANARLMRRAMYLQQFNFAIRYIRERKCRCRFSLSSRGERLAGVGGMHSNRSASESAPE